MDVTLHVAHDDDRRLGDREFLGEVAAVPGQLLHAPDIEPCALEDGFALELEELGRDRVLVRHGPRAELGVVLRPAAFRRFRPACHG